VLDPYLILILIIASFSGGLIVGAGSGTIGAIMLPVLTVFLGKNIHQSIGTSLILDCIIGGVAGFIFLRKGNVNIKSGILLAVTGVIGAVIGSQFTSFTPEGGLMLIVGLVLLVIGVNFLINGVQKNVDFIHSKTNFQWVKDNKTVSFIILGFCIGLASGFSGIGGGGFMAIILVLILGYEIHTAIGTSLIMMFFVAGAGSFGHILKGEILYDMMPFAIFAVAIGAIIGSLFANKINEDKLGRVIGVIFIIMGIAVILRIAFA
jgi:uncharacterized membrane protein YfcA